jgi:stearoyl-CoA desaturase (delta-9 desaturase)
MIRSPLLAVSVALVVNQLSLLVTTTWLHRALSHRAMTVSAGATRVFRVLTWVTTGIRPRQWVAVHRKHHAFTDVEGDPHSPLLEGFTKVQLLNVVLYRRVARNREAVAKYARDLPPDRWDRVLFDHAFLGLGLGIAALCLLVGPWLGVMAALIHVVLYLLLNAAVNAVGHRFGSRPHPNLATNSQWLAWLAAGEGLHNNHHAAPTSARLSMAKGEVDPAWPVIRFLQRRGWAQVRHAGPVLKQRVAA